MIKWLVLLIPHWETDTVVLLEKGGQVHIVCSYTDIKPGEVFDGMYELKTFTWLNWSFPYGQPINVRSFEPKVIA